MRFKQFINESQSIDLSFDEIVKDITTLNNVRRITRTGTRSFLFRLNNGNILKVTDDKSIYNYYKYALANPTNPFLIKFYNAAIVKNNYKFRYNKFLNNTLYVFELEPLYALTDKQKALIDALDKESDKIIKNKNFSKKKIPNYQVLLDLITNSDKFNMIKNLVINWINLFKGIKYYKFLDFKADNVMRRKDNSLVIIDPIFNPD